MPITQSRTKRPLCFIAMPFTAATSVNGRYTDLGKDELDTIYKLLQRILRRHGYEVRRSESRGDILADVVFDLDQADLVCADLTGLNPNVMYELGIRHGFTKKTIVLTQDLTELPFDLRAYHSIEYGWKTEREQRELGANLKSTLASVSNNPDIKFGPVHSHLGTKRLALREEERQTTITRLAALHAELDYLWAIFVRHIQALPDDIRSLFTRLETRLYVDIENADASYRAGFTEGCQRLQQDVPTATPAIDFMLSTGYVPGAFDHFLDVTCVYRCIATLRYNLHALNRKSAFEMCFTFLDYLMDDIPVLQDAVKHDRVGQDLGLRCKRLYEDPGAKEFLEALPPKLKFPEWEPD